MSKIKIFGINLIELLISLGVSSFLFLASSSIFFSFFSADLQVKQLDIIEQTKFDIQKDLSNSIRWAKHVTVANNHDAFSVEMPDKKIYTYNLKNGKLMKNNSPITQSEIIITSFQVNDYSRIQKYASLVILVDMEHFKFNSVKDTMKLAVSQRYGVK